ncbi:MAG: acyltransferase [Desulfobacterales bacterium]|jgi:acetyltransferase-like isoleucine patch superfamily enzyme
MPSVRRDHRPYVVKQAFLRFENFFVDRFLRPQFEQLGRGHRFMRPWYVELFGSPIRLGDYATVIATPDARIRMSIWPAGTAMGDIAIGNYALICPGVRISSGARIRIGDSSMLAHGVYITDADWHGLHDRVDLGKTAPVTIGDNVWLGDRVMVCKGVSIGDNSVVGAGSVVVSDIHENVVAAGNPARVIRRLDPDEPLRTRKDWYKDPGALSRDFRIWDREMLKGNTFGHWLRHLIKPAPRD